ncbi:MAG: FAD-dependent thymidylate synthase [Geminicoccaceae bacterium]
MALDPDKRAEIDSLRDMSGLTKRATVKEMEAILYEPLPVKGLEHGFIRVVDYMGDDAAIVQAARVSYGRGTKHVSGDRGLINYLMRHRHTSPFEMCELKLHVKLPIFVARQWIRHRTANVNEYSARYSVLDREFYIPEGEYLQKQRDAKAFVKKEEKSGQAALLSLFEAEQQAIASQSTTNMQGRDEQGLAGDDAFWAVDRIKRDSQRSFTAYERLLGDEEHPGIARELARMVLPLNTYTQWYWKVDLHNLLHFLRLRHDSHAQYEIRAYAEVLLDIARKWVPLATAAFEEYRVGGAELSATALQVIRRRLAGEAVTRETSSLSQGEWRELATLLPGLES